MGIHNVNMEDIDGDKLYNQNENDDKFAPRVPQKLPSMQRIGHQNEIFRHIEEKAAVDNETNQIFDFGSNIQAMIAENTPDRHDGNHQTDPPQDPLNTVLVGGNVDSTLAVIFVVVSKN